MLHSADGSCNGNLLLTDGVMLNLAIRTIDGIWLRLTDKFLLGLVEGPFDANLLGLTDGLLLGLERISNGFLY